MSVCPLAASLSRDRPTIKENKSCNKFFRLIQKKTCYTEYILC